MLEFVESLKKRLRLLRSDTEGMILSGSVRDMEQYKFLQGRLEGYRFVENEINTLLKNNPDLKEDL